MDLDLLFLFKVPFGSSFPGSLILSPGLFEGAHLASGTNSANMRFHPLSSIFVDFHFGLVWSVKAILNRLEQSNLYLVEDGWIPEWTGYKSIQRC